MRRARIDNNQKDIVDRLRAAGFSVVCLHTVGNGCPDIAVGIDGKTYLIEIKSDAGKLTGKQEAFFQGWRGCAFVARSFEQIIETIEADNDYRSDSDKCGTD